MRRVSLTTASIHASSPARTRAKTSGAPGQALERPGERARGRLVAGGQQGDQVVAQLGVVEPGGEQLGEHVVAAGARRAPARDERHELLVDHRHAPQERAPRAARPEVALGQRHRRRARERARDAQGVADVGGQPLVARAEDGPQDDVERELLHRAPAPAPGALAASARRARGRPRGSRRGRRRSARRGRRRA